MSLNSLEQGLRIVVLGASAGGIPAILQVLRNFSEDTPAAFLVVVHSAFESGEDISRAWRRKTGLQVQLAENNAPVQAGNVYLSVPDKHLILQQNKILLAAGPRENLFRPAIDVLFRSAAVHYGNRTIGILLSGRLNDGTAGLEAIKKCGGITLVQDPSQAPYPDMPRYAIKAVPVDYILDTADIYDKLVHILDSPLPPVVNIPDYLRRETELASSISSQVATEDYLGEQVPSSCPSCGGPLWEMDENVSGLSRFRCHVGHAFTREALLAGQDSALEKAMWLSLRTLEEKQKLMDRIVMDYRERGLDRLAKSYESKISEIAVNIKSIRRIMEISEE